MEVLTGVSNQVVVLLQYFSHSSLVAHPTTFAAEHLIFYGVILHSNIFFFRAIIVVADFRLVCDFKCTYAAICLRGSRIYSYRRESLASQQLTVTAIHACFRGRLRCCMLLLGCHDVSIVGFGTSQLNSFSVRRSHIVGWNKQRSDPKSLPDTDVRPTVVYNSQTVSMRGLDLCHAINLCLLLSGKQQQQQQGNPKSNVRFSCSQQRL
jgi:hypothetical protein